MMSVTINGRKIRSKIVYLVVGLFFLVNLSTLSYGETDFEKILRIQDKGELNEIVDKAEKVVEKNPDDKNSLKTLGIAYHNLADIGVKKAAKESVEYLKHANKLYPEDALILAVLGSSTTMVGKYSGKLVTEGRKYVNKGANMLDRAVKMSPDDVLVRVIRANNSRGIPKLFGRRNLHKTDLLHIVEIIKRSPKEVSTELQAQVYYKLGMVYDSEGDDSSAKSYFKKTIEVFPDSEFGKKAQKEL